MRVMLVAGVNNLIKGDTFDEITCAIERFWWNVVSQDKYHIRCGPHPASP